MLRERGIEFEYREYTKEPLSIDELREVLRKLGMTAAEVLRGRDAKKAGLDGTEGEEVLLSNMAENPRLLQRPIGVVGERAVLGRPPENLLTLVD